MGTQVYPSLPGLAPEVVREPYGKTVVYESASGKEARYTWYSTPRYRYVLTYNVLRDEVAAPSPWAAYGEVAVVLKFFEDHAAAFDSFVFTDPYDNTQRQVRFDGDGLSMRRIFGRWWECTVKLISVK